MTDREKLIELIKDGRGCPDDMAPFGDEVCSHCRYEQDLDCDIARLADFLIGKLEHIGKLEAERNDDE